VKARFRFVCVGKVGCFPSWARALLEPLLPRDAIQDPSEAKFLFLYFGSFPEQLKA
jgi:hypothetical protein